jgi:IMP dehydrogenase
MIPGTAARPLRSGDAGTRAGRVMREVPRTVSDLMIPAPASLSASASVAAAIDAIHRHGVAAVPVLEGGRVVGFVTPLQLLRQPPYRAVGEVMVAGISPARPQLSIDEAYELLSRQHLEVLPVVDDGGLAGLLTMHAVLEARSQERDPMTGLPWATALRTWAAAALERGQEVAILFIDMNNFRVVNKALGHVVGDDIIRSVAYLLSTQIDPRTDLLCRYAGDEFAIATTRRSGDARALAQRLRDAVSLPVEIGGAEQRVTAAIGFAGGRRVEARTAAHIASTIEDLLTMASRGSTIAKESGQAVVHHSRREEDRARAAGAAGPRTEEARLRLVRAAVERGAHASTAVVELALGAHHVQGRSSARIHGHGAPFLVAEATLRAIAAALGGEPGFLLDDLSLGAAEGEPVAMAVLTSSPESGDRLVGSASAPDAHTAVARAILSALNRRLGKTLAARLRALGAADGAGGGAPAPGGGAPAPAPAPPAQGRGGAEPFTSSGSGDPADRADRRPAD